LISTQTFRCNGLDILYAKFGIKHIYVFLKKRFHCIEINGLEIHHKTKSHVSNALLCRGS